MDLAAELEARLKEFLASGLVDLHENGGRTSFVSGLSWEARGDGEKPLLHLWAERFNVTRRVLAITDHSEQRLVLAVERFGRAKPDRLEFVRREFERGARQLSREEFREQLRVLLAEQFPDDTVESLTISADLEHSLSGSYARGLLHRRSLRSAFLAVPAGESSDTTDNCVTFALLWLSRARHSSAGGTIAGLRVILPKNTARTVAHRFGALDPRLPVDLYEHERCSTFSKKSIPGARATWIHGWFPPANRNPFCHAPAMRWTPSLPRSQTPSACIRQYKRGKCGCGSGDCPLRDGTTGACTLESVNAARN